MAMQWPKAGVQDVGSYTLSGVPFVREIPVMSGIHKVAMPAVTKFINVKNASSGTATVLHVGFTQAGVINGPHHFVLGNGMEKNLEVRCTEVWLRAASGTPDVNFIAGLTPITADQFPLLTGSVNGSGSILFSGVG